MSDEKKENENAQELKSQSKFEETMQSGKCGRKCSVGIVFLVVIVGLAALGLAFSAGRISQRGFAKRTNRGVGTIAPMMQNRSGGMMRSGQRGGFGQEIFGTLTKIDGNSLTVNYNNKDVVISVTSDTSITKSGEIAKQSDLALNQSVSVTGTSKSDGSVVASQIRIK